MIRMIKSRRMRMAGYIARMVKRNANMLLVAKSEGKRPRCRWVDTIRMDLGKIAWGGMDYFSLAQDRDQFRALVNAVMNLRVP
jgi:hypothetical protein